jgi:hypothetical protein
MRTVDTLSLYSRFDGPRIGSWIIDSDQSIDVDR